MNRLSNAIFVCEFEISGLQISHSQKEMLNNYVSESINGGTFSVESIDDQKDMVTGRYSLRNEFLCETEEDYLLTMTQDLSLVLKQKLNFSRKVVTKLGIRENYSWVKDLDDDGQFTVNKDPSGDFLFLLQLSGGQTVIHGPFSNLTEAEHEYKSLQ